MSDRLVDKDGTIHEKGWDGEYRPNQGIFGPEKDVDVWGNPKVERDFLGNPKEVRDWLGNPRESSSGEALYRSGGGGGGGNLIADSGPIVGLAILLVIGVFWLAWWLLKSLVRLCRSTPLVGYPLLGGLALFVLLASASGSSRTAAHARPTAAVAPSPMGAPTASPTARPTSTPYPTATPQPTSTSVTQTVRLVVGNTDGDGVYVRRTPQLSDRLKAWPDGTVLLGTGRTATGEGRTWWEVRDPDGNVGWVPTQYVIQR